MPSWKVHISAGVILTGLLIYGFYYSNFQDLFDYNNYSNFFFGLYVSFCAILGSIMPDFDYRKTRVRYALGPTLAAFLTLSYLYLRRYELLEINPNFIIVIILSFLFIPIVAGLVVPFKHHGKLHTITAAVIYAACWSALGILIYEFTIVQMGVAGLFGFVGYFSHLVLDLDLKFI